MKSLLSILVLSIVFAAVSALPSYAQSLKLSPMVHSAPPGGYNFQALVPLPSVMPDAALRDNNAFDVREASYTPNNGDAPVTTLDLKKKR